jgi:hypothetical protein
MIKLAEALWRLIAAVATAKSDVSFFIVFVCWFWIEGLEGFSPLAWERIGELRKNPQYPEMGVFQGWQKVVARGGWGSAGREKMVGSARRVDPRCRRRRRRCSRPTLLGRSEDVFA